MAAPYETQNHPFKPELEALRISNLPQVGAVMSEAQQLQHAAAFSGLMNDVTQSQFRRGDLDRNANRIQMIQAWQTRYSNPADPNDKGMAIAGMIGQGYNITKNHVTEQGNTAESNLVELLATGDTAMLLNMLEERSTVAAVNTARTLNGYVEAGTTHAANQADTVAKTYNLAHTRLRKSLNSGDKTDERSEAYINARAMNQESKSEAAVAKRAGHYRVDQSINVRFANIINQAAYEREERINMLNALHEEVSGGLGSWGLGDSSPDPERPAYLATTLDEWGEQLDEMSVYDSERAISMEQWVVESTRLHQRRALDQDPYDPSIPEFMPDRGVMVETPDGKQVLYDDGTIGSYTSAGVLERRHPNGELWSAPTAEYSEPTAFKNRASHTDEELRDITNNMMGAWESERNPHVEASAAYATRAFTERLEDNTIKSEETYAASVQHVTDLGNMLTGMVADRDGNLAAAVSELDNPTDTAAVAAIERRIDGEIAKIRDALDRAKASRDAKLVVVRTNRTKTNLMEYWRGFMGVTRPKEALGNNGSNVSMLPKGDLKWAGGRLNGKQGNWVLHRDGSTELHNPDGSVINYKPDGEVV